MEYEEISTKLSLPRPEALGRKDVDSSIITLKITDSKLSQHDPLNIDRLVMLRLLSMDGYYFSNLIALLLFPYLNHETIKLYTH
jgi:hypothetical protein